METRTQDEEKSGRRGVLCLLHGHPDPRVQEHQGKNLAQVLIKPRAKPVKQKGDVPWPCTTVPPSFPSRP